MMNAPYRVAGKIGKPHKLSGAFHFYTTLPFIADEFPSALFLRHQDQYIPQFVQEVTELAETEFIIQLEDCKSRESASALSGQELCLPEEEFLQCFDQEPSGWEFLLGYEVLDQSRSLGAIESISDNGHQYLAEVRMPSGKTFLLPLAEELITEINEAERKVSFDIPEGLTDL